MSASAGKYLDHYSNRSCVVLKRRIITTLLWDGIQCVKPVAFGRPYRKLGAMEQYIQVIERRNIDELLLIDIEATAQGREPNYDKIRSFCDNLYCPVTVGGGIGSLDHISKLLESGADKIAIKTNFDLIYSAARKFGSQAIVAVYDHNPNMSLQNIAAGHLIDRGAGELLLTNTNVDGMMHGYDYNIIAEASSKYSVPIIANGGCGEPNHMARALDSGASAVAAGSMFLYTEVTPRDCAKYLNKVGYKTRLECQT